MTRIELAVKDETAAHTGSYKEAHDVLEVLADSVFILAEDSDVYVISYVERNAEVFLERRPDIIVTPRKVRRKEHDSLILIYYTGSACGNGFDVLKSDAGLAEEFVHYTDYDLFDILGRITARLGLLLDPEDDLTLGIEYATQDLGPADVEANGILF